QGASQAFETGGVAAALLRMGVKLDKKDAVLNTLRAGQHADGGWSKGEGDSDLEATYRVMRAFYMMKETPDLAKLLGFVASCRHSDGSYSVKAGGTDIGGSYYATTVIRWARLLNGEPAFVETVGFAPIFNGKDLTGWEGDKSLWSAKDGMIVGNSPGLNHNDFLATEKSYGDFVLKLTFRINGSDGCNSGVQFRSVRVPGHEMSGYQADIGEGWWGGLYDESRRNKVLVAGDPKAIAKLNRGRWNEYVVRAMGGKIELFLNGLKSVEYKEDDDKIARDGRIALQIHAGGPMTVEFKDLWIQELPRPSVDNPNAPGFHLRTVEFGGAKRKYSVYLPTGYDGSKSFPVILFLHGSGERGEDGVVNAQVGLGPAILANPGLFPAIAVFPQARQTWSAGSDDSKAAL
ncbi:family 16 glycoside hydrolase, partial [Singulisphaera rosea]